MVNAFYLRFSAVPENNCEIIINFKFCSTCIYFGIGEENINTSPTAPYPTQQQLYQLFTNSATTQRFSLHLHEV